MPPYLRVVDESSWLNSSNSRCSRSAGMPMPVSRTATCSSLGSSPGSAVSTTSPASVNLTALPSRFTSTWRKRVTSPFRPVGKSRIDQEGELEPLARRRLGDQVERRLDARAQVERMPLQLQAAGVDLREVEDVVDDAEQRLAARADDLGELALARRQVGVEQQAAHADHRVHRRADLVAHRRQERPLGGVRLLGDARLLLEPLEQARVGHRDRRLVGEGLQDRRLLRVERAHLVPVEVEVATQYSSSTTMRDADHARELAIDFRGSRARGLKSSMNTGADMAAHDPSPIASGIRASPTWSASSASGRRREDAATHPRAA